MPIQLSSRNVTWAENSDTCVVTRYNKTTPTWVPAVIYAGTCDLQEGKGAIHYNEAGVVEQSDAACFLDGVVDVHLDDEMVFNKNADQTYLVVSTSSWSMVPVHTEINLKRGGLAYGGTT